MIGRTGPSHQRFRLALLLTALTGACSGGGGGPPNVAPTIVAAAFVGASSTPAPGETLQLTFSEDVTLAAGALFDDGDVSLSGNATLGTIGAAPSQIGARTIAVTLGTGVAFTPLATQIVLAEANDAVRDAAGQLGVGGTPVTIGRSDGSAPTLTNVTIAAIDDALNGTGPAGGVLQVPPNGWTLDLSFSDNGAINAAASAQITANVAVDTTAGSQPAGSNLRPFLTAVSASSTSARFLVPAAVTFPSAPFTLSCTVVDLSGLASNTVTFPATARPFADRLRPFETTTNAQQLWYLDFSRDVESFATSPIAGGASVDPTATPNGRSDFEDLLLVLGLSTSSPIPNVSGSQDSNAVAIARFKTAMLDALASLYNGANVQFTLSQPSGTFGSSSSVDYAALGFSQISVAGSSSTAGVLGVAIFDPSNATQNDDTRTNFQGIRLGVFLHTIVDSGLGPPSGSAFRLTFGPLAPALGGTAIGADAQDGSRLTGALTDARSDQIDTALQDFARFVAVVTAHECGHSMGLVQNGAMPVGLYGNDTVNFPGSQDGHIRTASLFPPGATNVMSPALSYSAAIHAATAFNSLNLAYLREQVFYGN